MFLFMEKIISGIQRLVNVASPDVYGALYVLISAHSAVKALNPNRKDRKGKTRSSQSFEDAG
jgi:hypothetical protein